MSVIQKDGTYLKILEDIMMDINPQKVGPTTT